MIAFLTESGLALSEQSLELAFSVLRQRNQLVLKDQKTLQQEQQIREQITNPKSQRKSSSVPAAHSSGNLYQKPAPLTEDEMYSLPLEELRRRAEAQSGQVDHSVIIGGRLS
jgi:hypothetical protein